MNSRGEKLSSNMEDYLEAIVILKKRNAIARVRDLGKMMNVKNPSVNNALNILSQKGYVVHEKYGGIDLTKEGEKVAREVLRKHKVITQFLVDVLRVDANVADEDACRIEHAISSNTFNKLNRFMSQYKKSNGVKARK